MIVFGLLFAVVIAGVIGLSYRFTVYALYPKTRTHENALEREMEIGNWEAETFEALEKEAFECPTPRGYNLFGYWIPCEGSKKTIVFVHGITYNLYGSVKYMWMFRRWGFNVLIYDHRNHGKSGGSVTTFGYYEKQDLSLMIDEALRRTGDGALIGTHGESMGGATVLQHIAVDPRPAFVIADCPFESAYAEFEHRLKEDYNLPPFPLLQMASFMSYLKTGAFFSEMSPIKTIESVETPILWVHGLDDRYVPPEHSMHMYEKKRGAKAYYWVKGARHAKAYYQDPVLYENAVRQFLEKEGILTKLESVREQASYSK